MGEFTHFDERGAGRMVDVSDKAITQRVARASGRIRMAADTLVLVRDGSVAKGDVLAVARLAGIMGAKQTATLIPLCHPLPLEGVTVDFAFVDEQTIEISAEVKVTARTGVEMEALTAVSIAALTIYDMCKSMDRDMVLGPICLDEKQGGRSGHFERQPPHDGATRQ